MSAAEPRAAMQTRSLIVREKVIAATIMLLAKGGPEYCTVERVAREAGVAKGSIQHQFKTQNALLVEVYRTLMNNTVKDALSSGVGGPEQSVAQRLERFIDHMLDRAGSVQRLALVRMLIAMTGKTPLSGKLKSAQPRVLGDAFRQLSEQIARSPDYSAEAGQFAGRIANKIVAGASWIAFAYLAHHQNTHLGTDAGAFVDDVREMMRCKLRNEVDAWRAAASKAA